MDLLLTRKVLTEINAKLRMVQKEPIKRRDARWYHCWDQDLGYGASLFELYSTRIEMFLSIDGEIVAWADFNIEAVERCREARFGRLYGEVFTYFPVDANPAVAEAASA